MANRLWTSNPVNTSHPLNQGRLAWQLCLPHLLGGPTWTDLTAQNPATISGMVNGFGWQPTGRPEGHAEIGFDGLNVGAELPSTFTFNAGSFAFACWMRNTAPYFAYLFYTFNIFNNGNVSIQNGQITFISYEYPNEDGVTTTEAYDDGPWHRVLCVHTPESHAIFVDGKVSVSVNSTVTGGSYSGTAGIGCQNPSPLYHPFIGSLDDVCLWGTNGLAASNPSEFAALDYAESSLGYPSALNRTGSRRFPVLLGAAPPSFRPWLLTRPPVLGSGVF